MAKRKYRLKERAARQERTRDRIVEAAMALHEEVGPSRTTISALAERAGVQRLTVYRHFPDERAILRACSSRWLESNPPPDIAKLQNADPAKRTRSVLFALYGYYQDTEAMWASLYRDVGKMPALDEPMAAFEGYLKTVGKALLADWAPLKSKRLRATLDHALRFATWQSLAGEGLSRGAIADLVCAWVRASSQGRLNATISAG